VDLVNEKSGFVPEKDFYDRRYGVNGWTKGNMLNVAVGQGEVLTTPIQMARFIMMIANNGKYFQPHLVEYTEDPLAGDIQRVYVEPHSVKNISDNTYELVKEGLRRVINSGTGRAAAVPEIEVAGKTGTAQNPHGKPHAWFIGFAPFSNPEVAIAVIIENGGGGGAEAAPVAGEIFDFYFHGYVHSARLAKTDGTKSRGQNKPALADSLIAPE
jgi:penicillin-binding protein 2